MKRTKISSFWSIRSTKSRSNRFRKTSSNLSAGFTAPPSQPMLKGRKCVAIPARQVVISTVSGKIARSR